MFNPYPGPRPFAANEYQIFAGREYEVSDLTSLIISHQVVLLYAQSGAGKTSLVNAGVSTSLAEKGVRLFPVARISIPAPKEAPLDGSTNAFTYSAIGDLLPNIPSDDLWRRRATLADAFGRLPKSADEVGEPDLRVFVLDQFEEMFSLHPERLSDRVGFFHQVAEALQTYRELRVLFVLREDFLASFNEFSGLLPESGRTTYRLDRLREAEALAAIKKPLEGTSRSFDRNVAEAMVQDLMVVTVASPTSGPPATVPGEFIEPVQLQVVCFTLFERLPETNTVITMEAYRKYGDPDEALESFYQKALEGAVAATGADEGQLREWFESQLVTPSGTRGLVFQGSERTGPILNVVIGELERQHLIRPEVRSGSRWYELTHDRFIKPIQRSNQEWRSVRWSQLLESYTEAIQHAVSLTSVSEKNLRQFLTSLAYATPGHHGPATQAVPQEALRVLEDAGLLLSEPGDGQLVYSLRDGAVARTIQLANQSWNAANWSQGAMLRNIESRAERWCKADSNRSELLLAREELREANPILSAARISGLEVSDQLSQFIEASRQAEWAAKVTLVRWTALLFGLVFIVSLFLPSTMPFRSQLLYYGAAGLGAVFTIVRQKNDDDLLFRSNGRFLLLLFTGALSGMTLSLLPNNIPTVLGGPVALVAGFFGTVVLLEIGRPSLERSNTQSS